MNAVIARTARFFWGDLSDFELRKFSILALLFFLIRGSYSMMYAMKDSAFNILVGYSWQPYAKIASLAFMTIVVVLYSHTVDKLSREKLFCVLCWTYGLLLFFMACVLAYPSLFSLHDIGYGGTVIVPGKTIGWILFVVLESFGSIATVMFWAFTTSTTTTDSAKRGYGMIVAITEISDMVGPLLVVCCVKKIGLSLLYAFGSSVVLCIPFVVMWYMRAIPNEPELGATAQGTTSGVWEGMRILLTHPYTMGIFVVSTTHDLMVSILEYQTGLAASQTYPSALDGGAGFAWFQGLQGFAIGAVSCIYAFFGAGFLMRRFGVRVCLFIYPTVLLLVFLVNGAIYFEGIAISTMLWVFFVSMTICRGLNHAVNRPTKEVLFTVTSRNIKFKTKSWIDAFGQRLLKASGAGATALLGPSFARLVPGGTAIAVVVVTFWTGVAWMTGRTFARLHKEEKIIE